MWHWARSQLPTRLSCCWTLPVSTSAPSSCELPAAWGIMVQHIPSKLTWLLQPLDTHVFTRFKQYLVREYRGGLVQGGAQASELPARLHAVAKACREVSQAHAWAYAFDANAFSAHAQRDVRQTILEELQWNRVPELPAALPTFPELVAILPA